MEADFWKERWNEGRTGFHQEHGCGDLRDHWASLGLAADETVLVPLCGKSKDLLWLAEQGHRVLGVEFSELAARAFFEETGLAFEETQEEHHLALRATGSKDLTILVGDFFALTPERLGPCRAAYDRAAIVALPPEMRARYAAHLLSLLTPSSDLGPRAILFITIAYDQAEMDGPPFSVPCEEIKGYLGPGLDCELLIHRVGAEIPGPLGERGLGALEENVLRVKERASRT